MFLCFSLCVFLFIPFQESVICSVDVLFLNLLFVNNFVKVFWYYDPIYNDVFTFCPDSSVKLEPVERRLVKIYVYGFNPSQVNHTLLD